MASEPTGPKSGTPKSGTSGLTPKQQAEQARAEAEASERRRERMIRIVGGLAVLLVVGGLLAVGFFAGQDKDSGTSVTAPPTADPDAASPKGVSSDTYGVKYGTGWTSADEAKLPTLEMWEDFQCPACKALEEAAGADIMALADAGKVKLLYRPTTFLDNSLASANQAAGNPNSSARATSAWGCAVDAGRTGPYHSTIFANQPSQEGDGYSDQQLIEFGTAAGVPEAETDAFTKCVQDGTYLAWSANSYQAFLEAGISGTPSANLNGVEISNSDLADIAILTQKIEAATAK